MKHSFLIQSRSFEDVGAYFHDKNIIFWVYTEQDRQGWKMEPASPSPA